MVIDCEQCFYEYNKGSIDSDGYQYNILSFILRGVIHPRNYIHIQENESQESIIK